MRFSEGDIKLILDNLEIKERVIFYSKDYKYRDWHDRIVKINVDEFRIYSHGYRWHYFNTYNFEKTVKLILNKKPFYSA